jgi:hypothetical protein
MRAIFQSFRVRKLTGKPAFLTIADCESETRRIYGGDYSLHSSAGEKPTEEIHRIEHKWWSLFWSCVGGAIGGTCGSVLVLWWKYGPSLMPKIKPSHPRLDSKPVIPSSGDVNHESPNP